MTFVPSFERALPLFAVTTLDPTRSILQTLGFEIESGSSKHAIMVTPGGRVSIYLSETQEAISPADLTIEMGGQSGIEVWRNHLVSQNITVTELSNVGWGKRKFSIKLAHGHILTFTQAKPVYQG